MLAAATTKQVALQSLLSTKQRQSLDTLIRKKPDEALRAQMRQASRTQFRADSAARRNRVQAQYP